MTSAEDKLRERAREDRLVFSGALGISVLAIIQFLQLSEGNSTLSFSLQCFALSIPLCAMGVVLADWELARKRQVRNDWLYRSVGYGGLIVTGVGLVGLFLHLGNVLGTFFYGWGTAGLYFIGVLVAFTVMGFSRGNRSRFLVKVVIAMVVISVLAAVLVSRLQISAPGG